MSVSNEILHIGNNKPEKIASSVRVEKCGILEGVRKRLFKCIMHERYSYLRGLREDCKVVKQWDEYTHRDTEACSSGLE